MKTFTIIFCLALIAITSANLMNDFEDVAKFIPAEKIETLSKEYLTTDTEFLQLVFYIKGKGFS